MKSIPDSLEWHVHKRPFTQDPSCFFQNPPYLLAEIHFHFIHTTLPFILSQSKPVNVHRSFSRIKRIGNCLTSICHVSCTVLCYVLCFNPLSKPTEEVFCRWGNWNFWIQKVRKEGLREFKPMQLTTLNIICYDHPDTATSPQCKILSTFNPQFSCNYFFKISSTF